jgi:predicted ATPase
MPHPPSTYDGRTTTGKPIDHATSRASARDVAQPLKRSLASLMPELLELGDSVPPQSSAELRPVRAELQAAFRDWFVGFSRAKPLFIAVDDLHRIDEASLACLALLSHELRRSAIALVATVDRDTKPVRWSR